MKCFNHEDKDAVGICVSCKKGLCRDCAIEYDGKLYCKDCFNAAQQRKNRKLVRNTKKAILGGVCAGVADYLGIDPIIVRVIWLVTFLIPPFIVFSILLYFLLWIILPRG